VGGRQQQRRRQTAAFDVGGVLRRDPLSRRTQQQEGRGLDCVDEGTAEVVVAGEVVGTTAVRWQWICGGFNWILMFVDEDLM